jgi:hypothetical protein
VGRGVSIRDNRLAPKDFGLVAGTGLEPVTFRL